MLALVAAMRSLGLFVGKPMPTETTPLAQIILKTPLQRFDFLGVHLEVDRKGRPTDTVKVLVFIEPPQCFYLCVSPVWAGYDDGLVFKQIKHIHNGAPE
jgi:hypothetical protein